jgi:membrane-associated protease RseP (regulator of RpoE activity)
MLGSSREGGVMRKAPTLAFCAVAALTMAANDATKFYQSVPHRTPDVPTNADPVFHPSSGDAKADLAAMETNGFEPVGYSAFNGKEAGKRAITKQARAVGATDVVYIEKYTDTQNAGAIGNTSFSRWGAFSFVTPMSVRRYDQLAIYFRKAPRHGLGVYPHPLSDDQKAQIGSNKGLVIAAVVNGSPAFMADILPGDILLDVGGKPVWDSDSMLAAINAAAGKPTTVNLFRSGQKITKEVSIPAGEW